MLDRSKWFFHPIFIFVFSILALATSLGLYIYWYVEVSKGLKSVVHTFDLDKSQIFTPQTWVVILTLSILVGLILVGVFIIFIYNQKLIQLYRMQHNFINNFTHELKTPVTSLNLYLETFLRYELSRDEQIKYVRYMLQDVNRLASNTNRILNLARIESKSFEGEQVKSDLVETVKRFYHNNPHMFQNCQINIHNPAGRSFLYPINVSLFEMLLMNLTTNATKYNDSEVPRIDITFAPQKRQLLIQFTDNGRGIEKGETKKIFRKFYQVGRAEDMTASGSGIGLYLAQHIVRIHKGKITADSEGLGKGSTFSVILPCKS
jgi:two-component system phosphate regulon sensor histidine kinase PhoR